MASEKKDHNENEDPKQSTSKAREKKSEKN